ncbi:PAS domain-containing sensor histidine kinase [Paraliomyxa miuraensis]|uniref:PAS domain-containing sensor histidine kinase n=1 Tax=Paraliomyxa miuraensis TaxID=376150 RepID=UPI00224DC7EA|nr:ATP-binding protein [Paraliomyxa miuraensis]MCX4242919.1 PAS domain S-box protein [Paraliomyxa miuraensis]
MALSDADSSHFLRSIIDSVADPIFVKDRDHRWVEFNRAFCELMGHPRERLIGKSDYEFFSKQEADVFWTMDDAVFRTGKENLNEETLTDARGVTRTISTKKSVFVDPERGPVLVGVIRDITELREAERRNLEMSQHLAAAAKFASLGEMAAGIAHEINTPLAIMQGLADELLDIAEDGELGLAEVVRINEEMSRTVMRVSKIITGLRAFARDGRKEEPAVVGIEEIVTETLELCGMHLRSRGIDLHVTGRLGGVWVRCRAVQIVQILLNLLNNARDAVASCPSPRIGIDVLAAEERVELRVLDSGPGVPPELRERIMEPFFTTKPVGSGTGIGLSIARSLAADNGGELRLDEDRAETCFVLVLPRVAAPSPDSEASL